MKRTKLEGIIRNASRFKNLHLAKSYAERTIKASGILLGDDGRYWVLPLGQAELLHRHGYEYAE
mgnify:CR=1 FL=1